MRFLFVHTYYPQFLNFFNEKYKLLLPDLTYTEHKQKLMGELFGDSDFYSAGIKNNGHEAEDVVANCEELQTKWAIEHTVKISGSFDFLSKVKYLRIYFKPEWIEKILWQQIQEYNPEVVYFQDIEFFTPAFLDKIKAGKRIIIAQKGSAIGKMQNFKKTDMIFAVAPSLVEVFLRAGLKVELFKLAFSQKILKIIPSSEKKLDCTFIGGFTKAHLNRIKFFNEAAKRVKIDFFGYGREFLDKDLLKLSRHHGEVWGREMYLTMMQSKMTVNYGIDMAGDYAGNMRLYEATGCGTMLLTEKRKNLNELFEIGKEVVVYDSPNDLAEKVKYYLANDEERKIIALAGQQRTLKDHNYDIRMREVIGKIQNFSK